MTAVINSSVDGLYTVLYCNVLYSTVLYCTVLYHTIMYRTVLYYNEKVRNLRTPAALYCNKKIRKFADREQTT